jgi:hypothetical protein
MPTPADARKGEEGQPGQQHGDLKHACLALVQEMAEPLTALANYLEAASRLHRDDIPSERTKLGEIIGKSQAQVLRADEILHRMRDLVREK